MPVFTVVPKNGQGKKYTLNCNFVLPLGPHLMDDKPGDTFPSRTVGINGHKNVDESHEKKMYTYSTSSKTDTSPSASGIWDTKHNLNTPTDSDGSNPKKSDDDTTPSPNSSQYTTKCKAFIQVWSALGLQ